MSKSTSRFLIPFIVFSIIISSFSYAEIKVEFNQTTGRMDIETTDGENVVITKHPTTGGLAINGT